MALTNSERQAAYRAKLKQAAREGKTQQQKERLDVLVPYLTKLSLKRIAYHKKLNLTDALILIIEKMDNDLINSFRKDDVARHNYFMGDSIDDVTNGDDFNRDDFMKSFDPNDYSRQKLLDDALARDAARLNPTQ